jgi:tetratricopeptide (TPR) repeat protein
VNLLPVMARTAFLFCLSFLLVPLLRDCRGAQISHPLYEEDLDRAGSLLLAMKMDEADSLIDRWIERNPARPAGYFFRAVACSWRIFLQPEGSDSDALKGKFKEAVRDCCRVAEKVRSRNESRFEGILYLGAIYGQEALLAMIEGKYLVMAPLAKRAWNTIEKALNIDPEYYDSYLGRGIYQYFTDVLPKMIKILALVYGFEGDREQGLENIRLAAARGLYSRDASKIMLLNLYSVIETPDSSVREMARKLHEKYPDNPLIHWRYGDILLRLKEYQAAAEIFQQVAERIENNYPFYRNKMFSRYSMTFRLGFCDSKTGKSAMALKRFDSILASSEVTPEWILPATYLEKGRIHFRLGEKEQARQSLEAVLDYSDYRGSREQARQLLQKLGK